MSKSLSYEYSGTKGDIAAIASELPQSGESLLSDGWMEISHSKQADAGSHTYIDSETGLRVRYDEPTPGAKGFEGKPHYHILNPDAHNNHDMYLDQNGEPCPKGSKQSHILPKGGK